MAVELLSKVENIKKGGGRRIEGNNREGKKQKGQEKREREKERGRERVRGERECPRSTDRPTCESAHAPKLDRKAAAPAAGAAKARREGAQEGSGARGRGGCVRVCFLE